MDSLTKFLLVILGCFVLFVVVRFIRQALARYRLGGIYELLEKEKRIQDRNKRLSDSELLRQGLEGLGSKSDPPADSDPK